MTQNGVFLSCPGSCDITMVSGMVGCGWTSLGQDKSEEEEQPDKEIEEEGGYWAGGRTRVPYVHF